MENTTPKKRVTKKMARQRQLGALAVIALLLLLLIIFVFKGCSKGGSGGGESSEPEVTTTTEATDITTTAVPETTTVTTTVNPLAAQVLIDKREVFIDNIGDSDVAIISGYPEGSSEENEVWKSLDESIATVDDLGHITGVGSGQTYVILSFDNNPGIEIDIKVSVAEGSSTVSTSTGSAADNVYNETFGGGSSEAYSYDSSLDGGSAFDTYTTPAQ